MLSTRRLLHIKKEPQSLTAYQNGARLYEHSFWCWVLVVYKEFALHVSDSLQNFLDALAFLDIFQARLLGVLALPDFLAQNRARNGGEKAAPFAIEPSLAVRNYI